MSNDANRRNRDRHASNFMLRLPTVFRSKLQMLQRRTGASMTTLAKRGLRQYLSRFGLWKPADDRRAGLPADEPA